MFESTVLGGSPLFSVFRETMPAAELISFQGILNSTTNIMLSRMERGETFDEAVAYCQSIGVAETDPSADVDGWDAAIKVAALVRITSYNVCYTKLLRVEDRSPSSSRS